MEIEELVIDKIRTRRNSGRKEHATERVDLARLEWLTFAQEEALDMAIYLEKLIQIERVRIQLTRNQ